jgi:hypothetical protein
MKIASAIASGNQPPVATFGTLAARNARSTVRKTTAPSSASQVGRRQSARATTRNRIVSTVIVPVTAIP